MSNKVISKEELKQSFLRHLVRSLAKRPDRATPLDKYQALALTVRDLMVERWIQTQIVYEEKFPRCICYISLEYLMGRTLGNAMINLGVFESVEEMVKELGFDIREIEEMETDAGLGNGGLGRLAACYLDSMATLGLPALGYGIRYDYGIFRQKIENGYQVEEPDSWLRQGNPWEIRRMDRTRIVEFYGNTEKSHKNTSKYSREWVNTQKVQAVPFDTPIPGYMVNNVNTLRLWAARSIHEFNLSSFNMGDYINANLEATLNENITRVLYPNDNNYEGKELRLKQQYFLVSATLQDIIHRFKTSGGNIRTFDEKICIQLNDTHPALAVPELMRLLVDIEGLDWDEAWGICVKTFGYTNHTLMSEALEKWPVSMMQKLLPRHVEIIYDINDRFLRRVRNKYPGDMEKLSRMSLIEEDGDKKIRMAYLAVIASNRVNGVAELHTELLKKGLFKDFYEYYPYKFVNVTNGITPRRWLLNANKSLAKAISEKIGMEWLRDLDQLRKLEAWAEDVEFQNRLFQIKRDNKVALAKYIFENNRIRINPDSIFDVQVKRLHEYKRQLLNILRIVTRYFELKDKPNEPVFPRTYIFGAKAAPGYYMAKMIIKLINSVADVINNDEEIEDKIKVVFVANYGVSLAEKIIPAADVSEQISLAGTEASGTGNMKFALNGALTIGTMDGANIEICNSVGRENIFIFGMTVEEVEALRQKGYNPQHFLDKEPRLKRTLDMIRTGYFSPEMPNLFDPILENLKTDYYMTIADFASYYETQKQISDLYQKKTEWMKKSILNIARMGMFSSDRSIKEYANKIWRLQSLEVPEHINGYKMLKLDT